MGANRIRVPGKPSEESLIEQLLLKDRALAATAEGITIADARAPDRPLIYVNEGFTRLTGYSAAETIGSNCRFLQGEATDPQTVAKIRECIAQERDCDVELINYRKDGTTFWNRLSITPIRDSAGITTHFVGVQSDVTRRHNAETTLREINRRLEKANAKMQADLQAAARVQQALLPTNIPAIDGIRIGWSYLPCDELAGDILDVLAIDEHRLAVYVIDVCGHGVSAALLATTLNRWLTRMPVSIRQDPVATLEQLNEAFQMEGERSQFFTCCYAVVDVHQKSMQFVSAGHPPPVLVRNAAVQEISATGFPVGILAEPNYEVQQVALVPGDRVYFYSDGATEQRSAQDQAFGVERLLAELLANTNVSLQSSIDLTLGAVLNTCIQGTSDDDISMLGIELRTD